MVSNRLDSEIKEGKVEAFNEIQNPNHHHPIPPNFSQIAPPPRKSSKTHKGGSTKAQAESAQAVWNVWRCSLVLPSRALQSLWVMSSACSFAAKRELPLICILCLLSDHCRQFVWLAGSFVLQGSTVSESDCTCILAWWFFCSRDSRLVGWIAMWSQPATKKMLSTSSRIPTLSLALQSFVYSWDGISDRSHPRTLIHISNTKYNLFKLRLQLTVNMATCCSP